MDITEDRLIETRYYQRSIQFECREPETYVSHNHKGKQWVPDIAYARWNHGAPITRVTLGGYILKKDGTPGQNRANIRYETPASRSWNSQWGTDAPQWVLDLFADSPPHHT